MRNSELLSYKQQISACTNMLKVVDVLGIFQDIINERKELVMTEETKPEKITFKDLDGVIEHLSVFEAQTLELTGHNPRLPVTALDVVKIVKKVFFRD